MSEEQRILDLIPQQPPFRFVDKISSIHDDYITGSYTFKKNEFYYLGHFPENPITPGVILIETMAQIGLVGLGIHYILQHYAADQRYIPIFTSAEVDFLKPVYPEEEVFVRGDKIYFRLNKLKSFIIMRNANKEVVCKGELSGMIANNT